MRRILLPNTSIECSALGFGCVGLTLHARVSGALRVLEEAFAGGITHFDVARVYGFGQAENILGRFLSGKRDRVTVTTKLGLNPPQAFARYRRLVSAGRLAVRHAPFLRGAARRLLSKPAVTPAAPTEAPGPTGLPRPAESAGAGPNPAFDPARAAMSLETSLDELKTDYVDILLLHECQLFDACRDDLRNFLDKQVAAGKVRAYGVGTAVENLGAADSLPADYKILQFADNPLQRNVDRLAALPGLAPRAFITHTVLQPLARIRDAARANAALVGRCSQRIGMDLGDPGALGDLLLRRAMTANPTGVVLVATTRVDHLAANLRAADSAGGRAGQLAEFEMFVSELIPRPAAAEVNGATT